MRCLLHRSQSLKELVLRKMGKSISPVCQSVCIPFVFFLFFFFFFFSLPELPKGALILSGHWKEVATAAWTIAGPYELQNVECSFVGHISLHVVGLRSSNKLAQGFHNRKPLGTMMGLVNWRDESFDLILLWGIFPAGSIAFSQGVAPMHPSQTENAPGTLRVRLWKVELGMGECASKRSNEQSQER